MELELEGQEIDSTYTIPEYVLLDPMPKIIEDILDMGKRKRSKNALFHTQTCQECHSKDVNTHTDSEY